MVEEFNFIEPMKAKLSDVSYLEAIADDETIAAGEKFDGYREQLHFGETRNEMFSSAGNSHIARVPQFQKVISLISRTVIDCEGMSPTRMREDNASCFKSDAANAITWQREYGEAFLVAFDILKLNGKDVTNLPFIKRARMLDGVMRYVKMAGLPIVQEKLVYTDKLSYYNTIVARTQAEGHEGIILKRLDALYKPGARGPAWLKVKRQEDFICTIKGFLPGYGKYEGLIGSIVFEGEGVSGSCSGMSDDERIDMTANQEDYVGRKCLIRAQAKTRLGALTSPRYMWMLED